MIKRLVNIILLTHTVDSNSHQFVKDYAIQVHFPVFEQKSIKV